MEKLLSFLKTIPEYATLVETLKKNAPAAVTGIGQINRSHLISALTQDLNRPLVLICQDDMAAKRLQVFHLLARMHRQRHFPSL